MTDTRPLRIAVIGTGYVGLVSAACLAHLGHHVVGVDADLAKVDALRHGAMPIFERGLQPMVSAQMRQGRLGFTDRLDDALHGADLALVAVGTPPRPSGATDLGALRRVVDAIARDASGPLAVVIKSTVPVGTTSATRRHLHAALARRGRHWRVPVLSNPEFLREGTATDDFLWPDRIVIGADAPDDTAVLERAFSALAARGVPIKRMSTRSAELSKYAANTMLAARISFINEMADIADATGADIDEVREGIGSDSRIGPAFLQAGIGYGGSCFPKDVSSLRHEARRHGVDSRMLDAVSATNTRHLRWPVETLLAELGGAVTLRGIRVAVWGLAFKPGTDDLREAASGVVLPELVRLGAQVQAHDPVSMRNAVAAFTGHRSLHWCATAADALKGADALLVLTEWAEFVDFPPARAIAAMRGRLVLDGRNALPARSWAAHGLRVRQVGRPTSAAVAPLPERPRHENGACPTLRTIHQPETPP